MKNTLRLLLVPLVTVAIAGAGFAQATSQTPAKPASPATTPKKKQAPPKVTRASGELVAADAEAGNLKVKTKDRELSLIAEAKETKDAVAKLKVGNIVTVAYTERGGKLILSSVLTKSAGKTSKPSEKPPEIDRKSTRLNSSHSRASRMPSSA